MVQDLSHSQAELLVEDFGVYSLQCLATCTNVSLVGFIRIAPFKIRLTGFVSGGFKNRNSMCLIDKFMQENFL